jgi:NADH-quinone oxidoreductase subunit G
MPTFSLNGQSLTVPVGTTILEAALAAGVEIPHYCYHPGLPVEGSCRMCQVEVERSPKLLVACATPVAEGMVVRSVSEKVEKARQSVLEFYLLNHPLDCPVCDKGGECPLQDYTMRFGPGGSRYTEPKVKRVKHRKIGPYIVFDAERCILCSRCVRFCRDVVGTGELGIVFRGAQSEIDLFPGRQLDNRYSGNVIDLCPVGALTSERYRFQARPWDLVKQEPSVCPGCSRGCNTVLDVRHLERKGPEILRVRPRHNGEVNGYWICDIGRFEALPLHGRCQLRGPSVRHDGALEPASVPAAAAALGERLAPILEAGGPGAVGIIASSRLTCEELYQVKRLASDVLETPHLDFRVRPAQQEGGDAAEDALLLRRDRTPNSAGARRLGVLPGAGGHDLAGMLRAARAGDLKALLVFGEDLLEEAALPEAGEALASLSFLAVWEVRETATGRRAHLLFPLPGANEKDGSFVNFAGRLQRIGKVVEPEGTVPALGEVLRELALARGKPFPPASPREVWPEVAAALGGGLPEDLFAVPEAGVALPADAP